MATVTPPYFFDEFLLPTRRKQPTPRERALGFTVKDLDWLHTLYYATETARTDLAAVTYPMKVERLLISAPGQTAIPIAGAFMMSPTPDDDKAVLYTPYGGLEVFENRAVLLSEVQERLKQPSQRTDLLQFLSITAYALDGFAISAETLVGQAVGARAAGEVRRASRICMQWGFGGAAVMALCFALTGG